MEQYRIGDYAKYLGVTPDLLKHYEDAGLIKPDRSESGYRYYRFNTAMLLIESIRLRNYGMTLREIREILVENSFDNCTMENRLASNMHLLREEISLNEALVQDYEEFLEWKKPLDDRDFDWSIRWSKPMYFLPHTDGERFLDEPLIYEILRSWMSHIPVVKSSLRLGADGQLTWGFVIEQDKQNRLCLPLNDSVIALPSRKMLYYQFRARIPRIADEHPSLNPAMQILSRMNLKPDGPAYRTTLMPCNWKKGIENQYGYYAVPIAEKV